MHASSVCNTDRRSFTINYAGYTRLKSVTYPGIGDGNLDQVSTPELFKLFSTVLLCSQWLRTSNNLNKQINDVYYRNMLVQIDYMKVYKYYSWLTSYHVLLCIIHKIQYAITSYVESRSR